MPISDPNIGKATQFKKGKSGNVKGRPKGIKSLTMVLKEMLEAKEINLEMTVQLPGKMAEVRRFNINCNHSLKYAMTMALLKQAMDGNVNAINTIFDRVEGRVETREKERDPEKTEFEDLTIEEKRKKIIELFPRVA